MQIIFNENLSRHNTMRVGGNADTLLLPESEDEMIRAYEETLEQKGRVFILGRGSNTIFRDDDFRGRIIKTTKACPRIKIVQSNRKSFRKRYLVEAGASVTNQSFLRFCRENNLAGPTYLQSVPGNIGGSIYMNAGTGIDEGLAISNTLKEVRVFDGRRIFTLPKESCGFLFRYSIFHKNHWLILSAIFELESKSGRKVEREIRSRMSFAKNWQDLGYPNTGSVFKEGYQHIEGLRGKRFGQAMFSIKSANWIINLGGAKTSEVLALVEWAIDLHEKMGYPKPVMEWIVR